MDDEENFHLLLSGKRNNETQEFIDLSYTVVIAKAFGFMKKRLKALTIDRGFGAKKNRDT